MDFKNLTSFIIESLLFKVNLKMELKNGEATFVPFLIYILLILK